MPTSKARRRARSNARRSPYRPTTANSSWTRRSGSFTNGGSGPTRKRSSSWP